MIAILLVILVIVLIYRRWRFVQQVNLIPGLSEPILAIIGDFFVFRKFLPRQSPCPAEFGMRAVCGLRLLFPNHPVIRVWLGFHPYVVIMTAEAAADVFKSTISFRKGDIFDFAHPWVGQGLVTSSGPKHRYFRKLLTPSFHFKILSDFLPVVNRQATLMVAKMSTMSTIEDVRTFVAISLIDILSETIMGGCKVSERNPAFVQSTANLFRLLSDRIVSPWLYPDSVYFRTRQGVTFTNFLQVVNDYAKMMIAERKGTIIATTDHESQAEPLIDALIHEQLRHPQVITDQDLLDQVNTFFLAGQDTSSLALTMAFYFLGQDIDVQDRLFREIEDIKESLDGRPPTLEAIQNRSPYLEAVVKEILRLCPPIFLHRVYEEDILVQGHTIPAGVEVVVATNLIQTDADHWPDPMKFQPDRFFDRDSSPVKKSDFSFLPFSLGSRNCIGRRYAMMTVKSILYHIIGNFKVTSLDARDHVLPMGNLFASSYRPIRVQLTKR